MGSRLYCLKERKMVQVSKVKDIMIKGRPAVTARCPNDGTKMVKFVKK